MGIKRETRRYFVQGVSPPSPQDQIAAEQLIHMSTSKSLHHRELNQGIVPLAMATEHILQLPKIHPAYPAGVAVHLPIKANPLQARGGHASKGDFIISYLERPFKLNQGGLPLMDLEKHSLAIKLSPSAPPLGRGGQGD